MCEQVGDGGGSIQGPVLPPRNKPEYMIIPVRELQRLRTLVKKEQKPRLDGLPAAYFALFGAAVATGAAVPPLMTSRGLPTWIIPTFIVSAAAFLVLGIILVAIARALGRARRGTAAEILDELSELERDWGKEQAGSAKGG
jgi:hypothetical protein